MHRRWTLLLFGLLAAACGSDAAPPSAAELAAVDPATRAQPSLPPQQPRSSDPRIAACAAALQLGDLSRVQAVLLELGEGHSPEAVCLRARLLASQGDTVGAVRELEQARKLWPDEGSLFATAAEIHAAGGRLESAHDEIRAGLARAGPTADLSRARGVLLLLQQGGAKAGLAHLLEARQKDPGVFFVSGPLAEAHRLLASQALAKEQPGEALVHVRAGLQVEPGNADLKLLNADALLASGDFDAALPAYEQLMREGRDLGASLAMDYQRGALVALRDGQRELAVQRYRRARELGASTKELGFGAQVLHEEALEQMQRADEAWEQRRWGDARAALAEALALEPENLAARHQLGVACFKELDYACAEKAWSEVLEQAAREGVALPDPVHLNLARALHAQQKFQELRSLLEGYLAATPEGEWAAQTREMLARLER